jgi:hypothetical protein
MNIVLEGFEQGKISGTWRVLDGPPVDAPIDAPPELPPRVVPGVMQHKGVWFTLYAPVAADWEPSTNARVFGVSPQQPVADPSNPLGARSPSGYPVYLGRVMFGDESFADEAALNAWRNAPTGGTGSGSTVTPIVDVRAMGDFEEDLPTAESKAYLVKQGQQVAFAIDHKGGDLRAALGNYGDTPEGHYRLAVSATPFDFTNADQGKTPNVIAGMPAGKVYLNAIRDHGGDGSFRISWYQA